MSKDFEEAGAKPSIGDAGPGRPSAWPSPAPSSDPASPPAPAAAPPAGGDAGPGRPAVKGITAEARCILVLRDPRHKTLVHEFQRAQAAAGLPAIVVRQADGRAELTLTYTLPRRLQVAVASILQPEAFQHSQKALKGQPRATVGPRGASATLPAATAETVALQLEQLLTKSSSQEGSTRMHNPSLPRHTLRDLDARLGNNEELEAARAEQLEKLKKLQEPDKKEATRQRQIAEVKQQLNALQQRDAENVRLDRYEEIANRLDEVESEHVGLMEGLQALLARVVDLVIGPVEENRNERAALVRTLEHLGKADLSLHAAVNEKRAEKGQPPFRIAVKTGAVQDALLYLSHKLKDVMIHRKRRDRKAVRLRLARDFAPQLRAIRDVLPQEPQRANTLLLELAASMAEAAQELPATLWETRPPAAPVLLIRYDDVRIEFPSVRREDYAY